MIHLNDEVMIFKDHDHTIVLSKIMIDQQEVSKVDIEHIKNLHIEKLKVFEQMDALSSDNTDQLIDLAKEVEKIEFALQRVWGFPEDIKFHEWYTVPHCTCPSMDNEDRKGTPYCIINENCPIHAFRSGLSEKFEAAYATEDVLTSCPKELITIVDNYDDFDALYRFFDEEMLGQLRYQGDEEFDLKITVTRVS